MLFRAARTLFYGLALGLFALFPLSAGAQQNSAYTVEHVEIDITASSAAAARDEALNAAGVKAFEMLIGRLLSGDVKNYKTPDADTVSAFVQDFEITREQISNVRYIGTFTFRFKPAAVRKFLNDHGYAYSDTPSRPLLVLPFYQWNSQTMLWGPDNPFLAAWGKIDGGRGLVPVTVPIGDLEDVSDVEDDDAMTFDANSLQRMTSRYGAGEAVIILAAPGAGQDPAAPQSLNIRLYSTLGGAPALSGEIEAGLADMRAEGTIFDAAVSKTRTFLQENWKKKTVAPAGKANQAKARVRFTTMREWINMQAALRFTQGITDVKTLSLSPREAIVELRYNGTEEGLAEMLQQSGIAIAPAALNGAPIYEMSFAR